MGAPLTAPKSKERAGLKSQLHHPYLYPSTQNRPFRGGSTPIVLITKQSGRRLCLLRVKVSNDLAVDRPLNFADTGDLQYNFLNRSSVFRLHARRRIKIGS